MSRYLFKPTSSYELWKHRIKLVVCQWGKPGGKPGKDDVLSSLSRRSYGVDAVDIGEGSVVIISSGPLNARRACIPNSRGERADAQALPMDYLLTRLGENRARLAQSVTIIETV